MPNQQIIDYLNQNKGNYSKEQLKQALLSVGYNEDDINEAMNIVYSAQPFQQPTQQPIEQPQSTQLPPQQTESLPQSMIQEASTPNKKTLIIGVVVLVLIGAGIGGYFWWKNKSSSSNTSQSGTNQVSQTQFKDKTEVPEILPIIEKAVKEIKDGYLVSHVGIQFFKNNDGSIDEDKSDINITFESKVSNNRTYQIIVVHYKLDGTFKSKDSPSIANIREDRTVAEVNKDMEDYKECWKTITIDLPEAVTMAKSIYNKYFFGAFMDTDLCSPPAPDEYDPYWTIDLKENPADNKKGYDYSVSINAVTGEVLD